MLTRTVAFSSSPWEEPHSCLARQWWDSSHGLDEIEDCSEACRLTYLEEEHPLVFLITFLLLLLSVLLATISTTISYSTEGLIFVVHILSIHFSCKNKCVECVSICNMHRHDHGLRIFTPRNKLTKLRDAIAISKTETMNHWGKALCNISAVQMEFCQIVFQSPRPQANGRFVGTIFAENR